MKSLRSPRALLPLLLLLGACADPGRQGGQGEVPLAVLNGRLFDGSGGPLVENAVVVIRGDRVVAAGPAAEVEIPEDARRIDAGGGLIMPGVIDNHVHLNLLLEKEKDPLTRWLRAGVTTLVDCGSPRGGVARLRARAARASRRAPRLLVAGPIFTAPKGYPALPGETEGDALAERVTSPEEAERKVDRLLGVEKADLVKVAIETGFSSDYNDPGGWPVPGRPVLAALARAAHRNGRTIRAHVTQPGELEAALETGFDATAHTPISDVPEALLVRAARAGMIFTTTANLWAEDPAATAAAQRNLTRYVRLGGRIALGTDVPFQPGSIMPVAEMRRLVEGGLTPREVLLAATSHGAHAVGRGKDLGTLAPGRLADLIVVAGDPLTRIGDMGRVRVVVRGGEVIVP